MTFDDLLERLRKEDEVTILELLGFNSDDLVDIFESFIYDRQDYLRNYYWEDSDSEGMGWEKTLH